MHTTKPQENADWRKTIESISKQKISVVTVFSDFCRISACAVALQTREEEYLETISHYTKEEVHQFAQAFSNLVNEMDSKPFEDVLGPYYTSIASKMTVDARGEFYTPQPVSNLMAQIVGMNDTITDDGEIIKNSPTVPLTVNEPACGSGGMILSLAKLYAPTDKDEKSYVDFIRATCQDLSPIACDMCYVNTTMWGIPAQIIWGNTLENTINKGWKNFHWIRVGEDQRLKSLKMVHKMKQKFGELVPTDKPDSQEYTSSMEKTQFNQTEFGF